MKTFHKIQTTSKYFKDKWLSITRKYKIYQTGNWRFEAMKNNDFMYKSAHWLWQNELGKLSQKFRLQQSGTNSSWLTGDKKIDKKWAVYYYWLHVNYLGQPVNWVWNKVHKNSQENVNYIVHFNILLSSFWAKKYY